MVKAVQPEAEVFSASSAESPNTQGKSKRQTKNDKLKIINPDSDVKFEIDFENDIDKGQQVFDFQSECEGLCGI